MAETLNKRILPALAAERRRNAQRYWAAKAARMTPPSFAPEGASQSPKQVTGTGDSDVAKQQAAQPNTNTQKVTP